MESNFHKIALAIAAKTLKYLDLEKLVYIKTVEHILW